MVGIGRTVFDGTHVEEFKANILGVLENVIGTHRNLILAKLEGGPLANTGVIAGMSGSPVYIDGRLIGAVSYALGSFSKEPIAGITPIAEMTDATTLRRRAPAGRPRAGRVPADAREPVRGVPQGARPGTGRSPSGRTTPSLLASAPWPGSAAASSARCCVRLRRRSSCPASSRISPISSAAPFAIRVSSRPAAASPDCAGRDAVRRTAQAGRRRRRHAGQRRPDARRHRHGHAHRRRPRLRLRPSDVQPRADRIPDDARLRLHGAAEPVLVDEAVDARARSSARSCRIARPRSPARSAPGRG